MNIVTSCNRYFCVNLPLALTYHNLQRYNNFIAGLTGLLFPSAQCCVSHVVLIECRELHECTWTQITVLHHKYKVRTVPSTSHLIYYIQISTVRHVTLCCLFLMKKDVPRREGYFFEGLCFCLAMNYPIIADCGRSGPVVSLHRHNG